MTVWIAAALAVAALTALAATLRGRRRSARSARAVIVDLDDSTALDRDTGAVRSVQKADLVIEADALGEIWTPAHLERLARTYWRFLTRITLGLVRVSYGEDERSVILLAPALKLLTFQAPRYEMDAARGVVRWRIERGLLVSRRRHNGAATCRSKCAAALATTPSTCACTWRWRSPTSTRRSPPSSAGAYTTPRSLVST